MTAFVYYLGALVFAGSLAWAALAAVEFIERRPHK